MKAIALEDVEKKNLIYNCNFDVLNYILKLSWKVYFQVNKVLNQMLILYLM